MKLHKRPVWFTGQHFTIDTALIADAISIANITKSDTVLDIGAGTGFFTAPLALHCRNVLAIENDNALVTMLRQKFATNPKVSVVAADFRRYTLPKKAFKVVSNIPYRITSDILKRLLFTNLEYCRGGVLLLQLQAAQKLVLARQFNPHKVFYRTFFDVTLQYEVPPSSFLPPPRVSSAVLQLTRNETTLPTDLKVKYLHFLRYLLCQPELSVQTALRRLFQKRQVRKIGEQHGIGLQQPLVSLLPREWLYCFLALLEQVPERFHPRG